MTTFDMKVEAKYYILTDSDTLKSFETHFAEKEKDELNKLLQSNRDPRWTQSVSYLADNFKADRKSVEGKVKREIGKDKWIIKKINR